MEKLSIPPGSIVFAPMEGITTEPYRQVIEKLYPEWDYLCCDFLRIPAVGQYPVKFLRKHIGENVLNSPVHRKTIYQVLCSENSLIQQTIQDLNSIDIPWLDLNLGCPSKTVVKRKGGSFLLSTPEILKKIIYELRDNFSGFFSVKIRLGFEDDKLFIDNLKMFEDLGVDAVTIHGRTRAQLYKGKASWEHIEKAVRVLNIPVLANGDIWNADDIKNCFEFTGCHAVMVARGALKKPWMAKEYKNKISYDLSETKNQIKDYFKNLHLYYLSKGLNDTKILKKFKELSRYIFDDFPNSHEIKRKIYLSHQLNQCTDSIFML
ncbi:MAG: tRNA-dihydrouridine synthase family protein [Halobacteriovoraceae bacterium]|nr:tRNA-dihydrouridine synthase family protein [Halobacteriovoraceae bacterium]MCB9094047.1 tRNA-dihydrouridine synthase family protein [Halobacteriovoraceae bacterium]